MIFLLILFLINHATSYSMRILQRHCDQSPHLSPNSNNDSRSFILLVLLLGLLFCLLFLGFLKGLIGLLWFPQIGMYGLDLLIDLPQSLPHYYENELRDQPVIYDLGGWPVHPSTGERTVRIISKRTEFYLNLVFFLSYPLAATVYLCSLCCRIKNIDSYQPCICYKHGKIIKIDGVCGKGSRILSQSKSKVNDEFKNLHSPSSTSSSSIESFGLDG